MTSRNGSHMCPRCNQHYVTDHRCAHRPFEPSENDSSVSNTILAAENVSEMFDSSSSSCSSDTSYSSDFSGGGGDSGGGGASGGW